MMMIDDDDTPPSYEPEGEIFKSSMTIDFSPAFSVSPCFWEGYFCIIEPKIVFSACFCSLFLYY
jgi:hypothetical protein